MLPSGVDDTEYKDKSNLSQEGSFLITRADQSQVRGWVVPGIRLIETEADNVSKTFSKEFNFRMAREQQFSNCNQQTSVDYF